MTHKEKGGISQSAHYQQVNVRCRADHKAQNMVEFDEEVSEAAILFLQAKQDSCTNKPDKATNLEASVGKPEVMPVYIS